MIKINLLTEAKPVKKKKGVLALGGAGRLNLLLILGGLLIGVLVVGVQWWVEASRLKEQEEKNRLAQQEVTRLEAVLKEVADFEDKKAKLQKKVDLINALKANQRGPVRLMDEVSNALPDLLWLERMEVKGNVITLDGKALNPPAVANFLENLKRVQAFQEPPDAVSAITNASEPHHATILIRYTPQLSQPASAATPRIAAIPPGFNSPARFINSPRVRTSLTPSEKDKAPDAVRADNSPSECPATEAGRTSG